MDVPFHKLIQQPFWVPFTISFHFRVFKKMLEEATDDSKFPNIQGLVAAYEVGQNIPNAMDTCTKYFPCKKIPSKTEDRKCSITSHLCPGYSIGCGLSGIFLPQTCGFVCPVAGLYCGK